MSSEYSKDVLQWQVPLWKVPLLYWEKNIPWNSFENPVSLEIGAREGGLSLWLAKKHFYVICSDIHNPQKMASTLHQKYHVQERINYESINATQIPYENYFDLIIMKSVLGGIGAHQRTDLQIQTIKEIHKALKPNGYFLFAENARASILHRSFRKFKAWNVYWNYPTLSFLQTHLTKHYSYVQIKSFGFLSTFAYSEKMQEVLVLLDNILCKFIPSYWQHIIYGIAKK